MPRVAGRLVMQATRRGRPDPAAAVHCLSHAPLPLQSLLLALFRFSSSQQQQPRRSRSAFVAERAPPPPSLRTTTKTRQSARLELRRVRLSVLHRLVVPLELR